MSPTAQNIRVDDGEVRRHLDDLQRAGEDAVPSFREFAQYMRIRTDNMFERLRLGGSYRGVKWKYFSPQYVRKDGTVVPAWGGIPKVRGKGMVKGRLRASGKNTRVKSGDAIMQDTMTLRGRAVQVIRLNRRVLEMGPGGLEYAAYQHRRRPFAFFELPRDVRELLRIVQRRLARLGGR